MTTAVSGASCADLPVRLLPLRAWKHVRITHRPHRRWDAIHTLAREFLATEGWRYLTRTLSPRSTLVLRRGHADARSRPPARALTKNGAVILELDKAAMGEIHESHVRKILERCGYEIIDSKMPGNTGIDILAVKKNVAGEVISILVVECKATGQDSVNYPRTSNTNAGKQLTSTWIAEKMKKMYQQGGELRKAAILMRQNLDKIKPAVSFQKNGLNRWAHQDRVPAFDAELVEQLLQEANWSGWN